MSASPQIEDGHVKIANELFDAVMRFPFTGRQLKVVMAVMRKTYGYNKKRDDVSASQIADLCGVQRNHVTSTLLELVEMKIIFKAVGEYGSLVEINKDYSGWTSPKTGHPPVPKQDTPCPNLGLVGAGDKSLIPLDGCPKSGQVSQNRTCPKTGQVASPKTGHTKDNLPKDISNIVRKISSDAFDAEFEEAWIAFPKREGGNSKAAAKKSWTARIREGIDPQAMIAGVREYAKQMQAAGSVGSRFVKMASTFFGPDHHFQAITQAVPSTQADWWQRAGFGKEWEAINAGCDERYAHLWRNGERIRTGATV